MKSILAFCFLLSMAFALPQQRTADDSRNAVILRFESENDGDGHYKFGYETSDGQTRDEEAVLKNAGTEDEALSVTGSFSFLAPDGVLYTVRYIADENGFRPEGDHLPSDRRAPPPLALPPAALGSLVGGGLG